MNAKHATATSKEEQFMNCDLVRELDFLIARTRSIGSGRANIALEPFGLKVRSYSVLSLACSDMAPTQRELAEFLALDPSQIVPLIDALEKQGYVARTADPADRRSKVITATTEGRDLYSKAHKATHASEQETLRALSPAEREQLRTLLARVALG